MRNWVGKIFICLFILFVTRELGYTISYFRYKDEDLVSKEALLLENQELKKDNEELYHLTNVEIPATFIARVGVRNIHNFYEEILLGNNNYAVKEGDPVINAEGLVGIVSKVDHTITVKLVTGSINVSVKVNDAYGTFHNGKITQLDKNAVIKEGDKVYTSGLTSIPEGIYVGKITKVLPDKENLGIEAEITLVDTNNLNYVGIYSRRD